MPIADNHSVPTTPRRRPSALPTRRMVVSAALALALGRCSLPACAQTTAGAGSRTDLAQRIDRLLADPALRGGIQGVLIRSLRDGAIWYARNPDLRFVPASNQKLITSAAALALLGPEWRYATRLVRTGPVEPDGTLRGDLELCGSGDPTLIDADLDAFVKAVRRAGIRRVQGRVLGDDSRFDALRYGEGWSWDDLSEAFAAQIGALTLNRSTVAIQVGPGRTVGDLVQVAITPRAGYPAIVVRAATAPAGAAQDLQVQRPLGTNTILVTGSVPIDSAPVVLWAPIDRPARFVAWVLAARLQAAGVDVEGGADETRVAPLSAIEVARHTSRPLAAIVAEMNKPSDNLIAECLLKTIGAEKGEAGTAAAGARVVDGWLRSVGIDSADLCIADGSGLARTNLVTPRALVDLLTAMHAHPSGRAFFDSLPLAGVDGTLRNRMRRTRAAGNCRAKTGSMRSVSSLSGIVTTRDGEMLAFSVLMNNHRGANDAARGIQDRIVETLADTIRGRP